MPAVLGISALYHDAAAALVVDGQIVAAAQEERFTRQKHDERLPEHAIAYCLKEAGLSPSELDLVGFYEKPLLKFDRVLETYLRHAPRGFGTFAKSIPLWLSEKLFVRRRLRKLVQGYTKRIAFLEHHESHAASAFLPSPFERAAILTIDGVGEWASASYGVGEGNSFRLMATQSFPDSLGLLYSAVTAFCGFRVNSGEYKLMGLAPYGSPRFADVIRDELVSIGNDGSVALNQRYFDYAVGQTMTNRRFASLFEGPPRKPESEITEREMDIAASIQAVINDAVIAMARHVRDATGETKLCMAGGVALNCVANGRLIEEQIFDDVWVQPAAGDAGGALGTALALSSVALGAERPSSPRQSGSLFGPSFTNDDIASRLTTLGAKFRQVGGDLDAEVASQLAEGAVVGWFQGRMEFGPRALGSRSILGDARNASLQRDLNLKIKYRESFRPFAPVVLEEHAADYFDFAKQRGPIGPHYYMLATCQVAKSQQLDASTEEHLTGLDKLLGVRSTIPAVTHVDQSARVQVVAKSRHERLWNLLSEFYRQTDCPVLINTSFNVRGEPIVCTPEDAYRCFMSTEMDVLAIGDCLLLKADQSTDLDLRTQLGERPLILD